MTKPTLKVEDGGLSSGGEAPDPRAVVEEAAELYGEEEDASLSPWPHENGEPVEYAPAAVPAKIAARLAEGIPRLNHLEMYEVKHLFRHKENWKKKGRTMHGQMKRPGGLLRHFADSNLIVLYNRLVWVRLNPMQRVALVYHELRHADPAGRLAGHDFEGFFDELAVFGTRTYRDWNRLANAAALGGEVTHQYSLDFNGGGGR